MRKLLLVMVALAIASVAKAQVNLQKAEVRLQKAEDSLPKAEVNLQEVYDFNRNQMKTTLEMFKEDDWGNTYFFVDIFHSLPFVSPTSFYAEISSSFYVWRKTALKNLRLHVEYNGGCGIGYENDMGYTGFPVNKAWLGGVEYFIQPKDTTINLTLRASYKNIRGGTSWMPMQLTAVWRIQNLFSVKSLVLSGFADFWWEDNMWESLGGQNTKCVFLAGPQLWYNIGRFFNCDNLLIGGKVEVSCNFTGNGTCPATPGWRVNPASGIKWNF